MCTWCGPPHYLSVLTGNSLVRLAPVADLLPEQDAVLKDVHQAKDGEAQEEAQVAADVAEEGRPVEAEHLERERNGSPCTYSEISIG